jgi:hypothetical protein
VSSTLANGWRTLPEGKNEENAKRLPESEGSCCLPAIQRWVAAGGAYRCLAAGSSIPRYAVDENLNS